MIGEYNRFCVPGEYPAKNKMKTIDLTIIWVDNEGYKNRLYL